jgi:hypothetical protein
VRYGMPELGLPGARKFADAYRDILAVTRLKLSGAGVSFDEYKKIVACLRQAHRLRRTLLSDTETTAMIYAITLIDRPQAAELRQRVRRTCGRRRRAFRRTRPDSRRHFQ